jgi:hypothetical protein
MGTHRAEPEHRSTAIKIFGASAVAAALLMGGPASVALAGPSNPSGPPNPGGGNPPPNPGGGNPPPNPGPGEGGGTVHPHGPLSIIRHIIINNRKFVLRFIHDATPQR